MFKAGKLHLLMTVLQPEKSLPHVKTALKQVFALQ